MRTVPDQRRVFIQRVSKAIVHELGHLTGLGHVYDLNNTKPNPVPDSNVMNDRSPLRTARFRDVPAAHFTEELRWTENPGEVQAFIVPNVNHYQAARQSFRYDVGQDRFVEQSLSNPLNATYKQIVTASPNPPPAQSPDAHGASSDVDDYLTEYVAPATPPTASSGQLGATTPADVANLFAAGLNQFQADVVDQLPGEMSIDAGALPFLDADVQSLIGLGEWLAGAAGDELDFSGTTSMAALNAALTTNGFVVDHLVSDAAFAQLNPDAPSDLVRAHKLYPLAELFASESLSADAIASLGALAGIDFSGQLDLLADAVLSLTVGVDTAGFYLLPGQILRFRADAQAELEASALAFVEVAGEAGLNVAAAIELSTDNPDGRIRVSDLIASLEDHVEFEFGGSASLQVNADVSLPDASTLPLAGSWVWDIDTTGFSLDAASSGFESGVVLDFLAEKLGSGMSAVASAFAGAADFADGIPFVGNEIATALSQLSAGGLEYDNPYATAEEYLAERGFIVQSIVSPAQLLDYAIRGTALPNTLVRFAYSGSATQAMPSVAVSGSKTLNFGPASASASFAGQLSGEAEANLALTLGVDTTGGFYVVEGSTLDAGIEISGSLTGTATAAGFVDAELSAAGTLEASVVLTLSDGDGTSNERLYAPSAALSDAFEDADAVSLSGQLDLDDLGLTITIEALDAILPSIELTAEASIDLATGVAAGTLNAQSLTDSLAKMVLVGIDAIADEASALANTAYDIPLIGKPIQQGLRTGFGDAFTFDPGTQSATQYLATRGISVLPGAITTTDLFAGAYQGSDLIRMRYQRTVNPAGFTANVSNGKWEVGTGDAKLALSLSGALNVDPSFLIDITFGVHSTNGPFIVEKSNGYAIDLSLDVSGSVAGKADIGKLVKLDAQVDATMSLGVGLRLHDGDATTGERLYLIPGFAPQSYSVADWVSSNRTQAVELEGDIAALAELTINNPGSQIELIGQFLPSSFSWNVDVAYDIFEKAGSFEIRQDANITALTNLLSGGAKQQILGRFLDYVDRHNPLPQSVRDALTTDIPFLGGSLLSQAGIEGLNVLINPRQYQTTSEAEIEESGAGISLNIDVANPTNLIALLSGGTADLISIEVQQNHDVISKSIPAIPAAPIATFFGVASVTLEFDLIFSLSVGVDFRAGFDTRGFYLESNESIFTATGSLGGALDVSLALTIVDLAEVILDVPIVIEVGVGIVAPDGGSKVRANQILTAEKPLSLDVTLDLALEGRVGFDGPDADRKLDPLLSLSTGRLTAPPIKLFEANGTVGDVAATMQKFKEDLERIGTQVCAITVVLNPLLVPAVCGAVFSDEIAQAGREFDEWRRERQAVAQKWGQDRIDVAVKEWHKVVETVEELGRDFDENVIQPFLQFSGLDEILANAKDLAESIFGSKWESTPIPHRATFSAQVVDSVLIVDWDDALAASVTNWAKKLDSEESQRTLAGAQIAVLMTEDAIFIDGPDFVVNEEVQHRECAIWESCDNQYRHANIQHPNMHQFSTAGITRIEIRGSEFADQLAIGYDPEETLSVFLPVRLDGYGGHDLLVGGRGDDFILGGDGHDTLLGQFGNDVLAGQIGNDFLVGDFGDDTMIGGADNDFIDGETGDDPGHEYPPFFPDAPRPDERDVLEGDDGDDTLIAGGGPDKLYGGNGNDQLLGGDGPDTLAGLAGDDFLDGGAGNDSLDGGNDDDYLVGNAGHDELHGGTGSDMLFGDDEFGNLTGNDELNGGDGFDILDGGKGNDTLRGGADADLLRGGPGNDHLYGSLDESGDQTNGNDILLGGPDNDLIYGGSSGANRNNVPDQNATGYAILSGGDGTDTIFGNSGPDLIDGEKGPDQINAIQGEDTLQSSSGSDTMFGGLDGNRLFGRIAINSGSQFYARHVLFDRPEDEYAYSVGGFSDIHIDYATLAENTNLAVVQHTLFHGETLTIEEIAKLLLHNGSRAAFNHTIRVDGGEIVLSDSATIAGPISLHEQGLLHGDALAIQSNTNITAFDDSRIEFTEALDLSGGSIYLRDSTSLTSPAISLSQSSVLDVRDTSSVAIAAISLSQASTLDVRSAVTGPGTLDARDASVVHIFGGHIEADRPVSIFDNATLSGNGRIESHVTVGGSTAGMTAKLAPRSATGYGSLHVSGVMMNQNARFVVGFDSSCSHPTNDWLAVKGSVQLGGATLNFENGDSGSLGADTFRFRIVDNDGTDPIQGTFAGLPEGAVIDANLFGTHYATITYRGGDGNDVEIVAIPQLLDAWGLVDGSLEFDFRLPVDQAMVNAQSFKVHGTLTGYYTVEGEDWSFEVVGDKVTFTPGRAFVPNEVIRVSVPSALDAGISADSIHGNPLLHGKVLEFRGESLRGPGQYTHHTGIGPPERMGSTAGDLDGDGDIDLIDNSGRIHLNDGTGLGWTQGQDLDLGNEVFGGDFANDVALGDVDNDGDLDALFSGSWVYAIGSLLFENNGDGTFSGPRDAILEAPGLDWVLDEGHAAEFGDFNFDGILDIVVTPYRGAIRIYFGDGTGKFESEFPWGGVEELQQLCGVLGCAGFGHTASVGDFDGDGDLDGVRTGSAFYSGFPGTPVNSNYMWSNPAQRYCVEATTPEFFVIEPNDSAKNTGSPLVADLNGDGRADMVRPWRNFGEAQNLEVLLSSGFPNGHYEDPTAPSLDLRPGLSSTDLGLFSGNVTFGLGDLDADGDVDLTTYGKDCYWGGGGGYPSCSTQFWTNDGNGRFTVGTELYTNFAGSTVADFNGDGALDVMDGYNGQIVLSTIAPGDANGDRKFDALDIDAILAGRNAVGYDRILDADEDGDIDQDDVRHIVYDVLGTTYGDTDLNGYVDHRDAHRLAASFGTAGGWTSGNFDGSATIGLAHLAMLQAKMRPDLDPPTIVSASIADSGVYGDGLQEIRLTFSEQMAPATLGPAAFTLTRDGVNVIPWTNIAVTADLRTVILKFAPLVVGDYTFAIAAQSTTDEVGNPLAAAPIEWSLDVVDATIRWVGPDGGNWNTPANWDLGRVPNADDLVAVSMPGDASVVVSSGEISVTRLITDDRIRITAGSLEIRESGELRGGVDLAGGTFIATANISVSGNSSWTSGTLLGSGSLTNIGTFAVSDVAAKYLATTLHNAGTMIVSSSTIRLGPTENAAGAIVNQSGAELRFEGSGSIVHHYTVSGNRVENFGSITTGAAAAATIAVPLNSTGGEIDVTHGTLSLTGGGEQAGTIWTVETGAVLAFSGGTHVLAGNISGSGEGVVRVTTTVATSSADANLSLGDLTFELAGTATVAPNTELALDANGVWTAGTIDGGGQFVNAGSLAVTTNAPFLNTTLENVGEMSIAGILHTSGAEDQPGWLLNQSDATLRFETGGIVRHHYVETESRVENRGTIIGAATATASIEIAFHNDNGTIDIQQGNLALANGGASTGGTWNTAAGASLAFSGGEHVLSGEYNGTGLGAVRFSGGTLRVLSNTAASIEVGGNGLFFSGSTSRVDGQLALAGMATWETGWIYGAGTIDANGEFEIALTSSKFLGTTLRNAGLMRYTGSGLRFGPDVGLAGVVENLAGGQFRFEGTGNIAHNHVVAASRVINRGSLVRDASGSSSISLPFHNEGGSIETLQGTLTLNAGGASTGGLWSTAANSTLSFAGGTFVVTGDHNGASLGAMQLAAGEFDIPVNSTASLNIAANGFALAGGIVNAKGNLVLGGVTNWSAGTLHGPGAIDNDGELIVSAASEKHLGTTFRNFATLRYVGSSLHLGPFSNVPGMLENMPSGVFRFEGVGGVNHYWDVPGSRFTNRGVLIRDASGTSSVAVPFHNDGGTIQTLQGAFSIAAGGSSTGGEWNSAAASTLSFTGGAFEISGRHSGTSLGMIQLNAATFNVSLGASAAFDFEANGFVIASGTLNAVGNVALEGSTVWTGGTIYGTGTVENTGELVISTAAAKHLGSTLRNHGMLRYVGSGLAMGPHSNTPGIIENQPGGEFRIDGTGGINHYWPVDGSRLTNRGLLVRDAAGASTIAIYFDNAGGRVNAVQGTLILGSTVANLNGGNLNGGEWRVGPGASLSFGASNITTLAAGVTIDGEGAAFANLTNLTTIADGASLALLGGHDFNTTGNFELFGALTLGPGSTLTVAGAFTHSASAVTSIQVSGQNSGEFGSISVAGVATLAGDLSLVAQVPYVPGPGSNFPVIAYASRQGGFVAAVGNGFHVDVQYDPTIATAVVTTAPQAPAAIIARARPAEAFASTRQTTEGRHGQRNAAASHQLAIDEALSAYNMTRREQRHTRGLIRGMR